ncbi:MAG: hypothetical protein RIQ98_202, partial [Bacteroidota bacterium]
MLGMFLPSFAFAQEIKVPAGFQVSEIAKELGATRHLTVSKQGHVYAKLSKLKDGNGIVQLKDANHDGVFEDQKWFGNYPGTGIMIDQNFFYAASNKG